jgi:CxxC motif-containing protein (DUF1111 family)
MKIRRSIALHAAVALAVTASVTVAQVPPRPQPAPPPAPQPGEPLAGLDAKSLAQFAAGLDEFNNVETPETGLGPIFNNVSCAACHLSPAVGGSSAVFVTRYGRMQNGVFDPLASQGGSLLHQFSIDPQVREVIPAEANVVARRMTTPLFGAGLIEAIPDAALAMSESRPKADGVRGHVSRITDIASGMPRAGRFGWKGQHATLLSFAADAYLNEMGITNRFFPVENAPNGNRALLASFDTVADPEDVVDPATGRSDIDALADFMRLLAPPPRLAFTASAAAGEILFTTTGCAECHQPRYMTAPNAVAALDRKPANLYSDLLLHDMGSLGDGIAQANAGVREMRTAPLWGLRLRRLYLHDGRAGTVDAAIRAHDGEAAPARNRYTKLPATLQQQLVDFLGSI